ncbi:MAG: glutamine--tRNA ligase/YqeY domain fusion protein [Fibrobacterales bacterium]
MSNTKVNSETQEEFVGTNFIQEIIDADLQSGKHGGKVHTRFPPEPNGYLHIGHAKSICLNFGIAEKNGGVTNLRFDDTNPSKEENEYVESIKEDVKWLGFNWGERLFFSSDYFDTLFEYAVHLIKNGDAFVCSLNSEQTREYRGSLTEAGKNSPDRDRTSEENLDLFSRMKAGEFDEGTYTLRAKIDMAASNMNLRDPIIYRIMKAHHHRTGDAWCIYPMYDFTHGQSDALEGITHSICTLEFEDHRPLYNWFIEHLPVPCQPQQIEFARLNITHTMMSKRNLLTLVNEKIVDGWNDPRLPTLAGMRRRGYTSASIRDFCDRIGVAKANSIVDKALLDHCLREDLNKHALRAMAVINPLKVVITNYPENQTEELPAENNPIDESAGSRMLPFGRDIWIEQEDFMEDAPKKFFRLAPGREVRLKHAYFIKCKEVIKDEAGKITELHCTYDPLTKSGMDVERKVKGTIHWVSAAHAVNAEVRIFDELFTKENPHDFPEGGSFQDNLNPDSLTTVTQVKLEPSLANTPLGQGYQFLRNGYFCSDSVDSKSDALVFNKTVGLKDGWGKAKKKG